MLTARIQAHGAVTDNIYFNQTEMQHSLNVVGVCEARKQTKLITTKYDSTYTTCSTSRATHRM